MTTPGSSFNPTPLDHEVNLEVSCVRRLCGNNHHTCNFELLRSTILDLPLTFDITRGPFPSLAGCNQRCKSATPDLRVERGRAKGEML
ncbi:hypothetical protein TNCV_862341 [Trichonephila clavipes]|nr:hypothetical protein TNCV_862341 [Trichonephila clavipes]